MTQLLRAFSDTGGIYYKEGFEVLIAADKNLKYQQNLRVRCIAIVVLTSTSWPRIRREIAAVVRAIDGASQESFTEGSYRSGRFNLNTEE